MPASFKHSFPGAPLFGADVRSLAALRIGLGLTVLIDALLRLRDCQAFYTDWGILPRSLSLPANPIEFFLSIYEISGNGTLPMIALLCTALSATAMLVGYRTRLSTMITWFLVISLHTRNPLVIQGGDTLLRAMLFWSMFLPLGACWSADASRHETRGMHILNAGSVAFGLQVFMMYCFTVAIKLQGEAWRDGTALYYALNVDQFISPLGQLLRAFPETLRALTPLVLGWEALGALLLYVPWKTSLFRSVAISGFLLMHLGFLLLLEVGHFPWVNMISLLFFIPSEVWDRIAPREQARTGARASILWQAVAAVYLIAVLQWNFATLQKKFEVPAVVDVLISLARMDQYWHMFAPSPQKDDGWYIIEATLNNGSQRDIFPALTDFESSEPLNEAKPDSLSRRYPNERWRKYFMNLWDLQEKDKFRHLANYLCRGWNARHHDAENIEKLQIIFMLERTPPPGKIPMVRRTSLWVQTCS